MNEIITIVVILTLLPAGLVFFLDYCFGRPGDESPNRSAILFGYTYFLAKWRLKRIGEWSGINNQVKQAISSAQTRSERMDITQNMKTICVQKARKYFTWEMAVGMCPVCFHVWVSLVVYSMCWDKFFYLLENYFCLFEKCSIFVLPLILGHIVLRILKRYL